MPITDDRAYYARRIETSLRLAREAKDPGIRKIHLTLVAQYRARAAEAEEQLAAKDADDPQGRSAFRPAAMGADIPRPAVRSL